jgi:hypothetical protein
MNSMAAAQVLLRCWSCSAISSSGPAGSTGRAEAGKGSRAQGRQKQMFDYVDEFYVGVVGYQGCDQERGKGCMRVTHARMRLSSDLIWAAAHLLNALHVNEHQHSHAGML